MMRTCYRLKTTERKSFLVEHDEKRNQDGRREQEGAPSRNKRAVMYDLSGGNNASHADFSEHVDEGKAQNNNIHNENDNQSQPVASRYKDNGSESHPNATDTPAMRARGLGHRRSIINR